MHQLQLLDMQLVGDGASICLAQSAQSAARVRRGRDAGRRMSVRALLLSSPAVTARRMFFITLRAPMEQTCCQRAAVSKRQPREGQKEREFTLGRAFLRPCDRRRTLTLRALHCMHPIRLFTCDFLSPMVAATRLSTRPLSVLFHPPAAPRVSVTLPARQSGSRAAGQLENDENNGKSEKSN